MNTIYFLIALYLVSALLMYVWVRIAHSPKGRFYGLSLDWTDAFVILVPFFNTAFCIYAWAFENPYEDN
jgi:hypothetical protein